MLTVEVVNEIFYFFFLIRVLRDYFVVPQREDPCQEHNGESESKKHKEAGDAPNNADEDNAVGGQVAKSEPTCSDSVVQQKCDHEETPSTENIITLSGEFDKKEPKQLGAIKKDYALLEKYGMKRKKSRKSPLADAPGREQARQVLNERLFESQMIFKKERIFPENTMASGDLSQIKSRMGVQYLAPKDQKQLYSTYLLNKKNSVSMQEQFMIFLFVCECVCMWDRGIERWRRVERQREEIDRVVILKL